VGAVKHKPKSPEAAEIAFAPSEFASSLSNWGEMALVLLEAEKGGGWGANYPSFTAYIRAVARAIDVHESALWRVVSAGRFYLSLGGGFDQIRLPPLPEVAKSVGAEQLELIEKVGRVAPRPVVSELLSKTLAGTLSRGRLREIWNVYRPSTGGVTARGADVRGLVTLRRVPAPERRLVHRGSALYALLEADSGWLGEKPARYHVFTDPEISVCHRHSGQGRRETFHDPDAIAVVQRAANVECEFHLVEFFPRGAGARGSDPNTRYQYWTDYVDFAWALISHEDAEMVERMSKRIGVLLANGKQVRMLRQAERHPKGGSRTGETAKLLLAQMI